MEDEELLREYAAGHSEAAFRTLVERYVPLVYGVAFRQLGNASSAEDVTQAVFIILARKASGLPRGTILSGWLYRAAKFTADKARRTEYRREEREREAMQMQATATDPDWSRLAPILDDAIAQLRESERTVILLRFFENKSLKEVGQVLSISENTAQKRVSRAVDKLRGVLVKEGVAISATAMTTAISSHAVPMVPAQLSAAAATAGLGHGAVSSAVLNLAHSAPHPWLSFKAVSAGVFGLMILTTTVLITFHFSTRHPARLEPATGAGVAQITVRVPQPQPAPLAPGLADVRFNLLGTPGLGFDAAYVHDGQAQTVSGVLPGEISFQADAFTMRIIVRGPGQFGFEAYRNDRRLGWSNPGSVTNGSTFEMESMAGGQGLRFRRINGNAPVGN
ncbi:MAG TPA: sigma-70 family RNA polymerase sigma factor [Pseudomonadales bacterium]|nr:sigma-70 family RNA polymerase sigma factor [Pseudomonadales bacterium]